MTRQQSAPGARRCTDDDGAVLVEFALFGPVLVLLAMGLLEFGLVMKADNTLHTATRSAARVGTNTFAGGGDDQYADYNILKSLAAGVGTIDSDDIQKVVVYRANGSTGTVPAACRSFDPPNGLYGTPGSNCNVYTGDFLEALPATSAGWSEAYDSGWEPEGRETDEDIGLDYVGVWIEMEHDYITGIFGASVTMTERAVFRIEPDLS